MRFVAWFLLIAILVVFPNIGIDTGPSIQMPDSSSATPYASPLPAVEVAYAQVEYSVESLEVSVFRDGIVRVIEIIAVDTAQSTITVPLTTPSAENVVVFDVRDRPLAFTLTQSNMVIETLGTPLATLMYESSAITSKDGNVWTIRFSTQFPLELTMPEGASIIYLNSVPSGITTTEAKTVLTLGAGQWEISYIIPLTVLTAVITEPAATPTPTQPVEPSPVELEATPTPTPQPEATPTSPVGATPTPAPTTPEAEAAPAAAREEQVTLLGIPGGALTLVIVAVVIVSAIIAFTKFRRKSQYTPSSGTGLRPEEESALKFLRDRGGAAVESEIREHIGLPKSSAWRLIGRLESSGHVKITRVGSQNRVELKG